MPWTNKAAEVQHIHDRFSLVNYQGMGPVSKIVSISGSGDKVQVRGGSGWLQSTVKRPRQRGSL